MENVENPNPNSDQPIGAPHPEANQDPNQDPSAPYTPPKPVKPPMPLWKKILIILFLIVCAFGVYDTFFPSKNSLTIDEFMPKTTIKPTANPTATAIPTSPTPTLSPSTTPATATPSAKKSS